MSRSARTKDSCVAQEIKVMVGGVSDSVIHDSSG